MCESEPLTVSAASNRGAPLLGLGLHAGAATVNSSVWTYFIVIFAKLDQALTKLN